MIILSFLLLFQNSLISEFWELLSFFLGIIILFPPILLTKPIKTLTIKLTGSDQLQNVFERRIQYGC